jgi:hypothetical protein
MGGRLYRNPPGKARPAEREFAVKTPLRRSVRQAEAGKWIDDPAQAEGVLGCVSMSSFQPAGATPVSADEGAEASVDVTLLDEMLAMTVRERLEQNDRAIRAINELRAGFAALERSRDGGAG